MAAEDLEAIRNVLALYCHLIDAKEWDRLDEVYAPGCSYNRGGSEPIEGMAAIAGYLAEDFGRPNQPEVHTSSNHHIELDGDGTSATGRSKFIALFGDARVVAGDYEDVYVRTDGGWRIQRRTAWVRVPAERAPAGQAPGAASS